MDRVTIPEVDMWTVAKSSRTQRRSILNFAPKIGLSIVNYARLDEIDDFYTECQNFRDYYRDPYNKVHRPEMFKIHQGKCGFRTRDKTIDMLMSPIVWVRERRPQICPLAEDKSLRFKQGMQLSGQYNTSPCILFKR